MQVVGDAKDDQVDILEVEQPAKIGEVMGDPALGGELFGVTGRRRCHGDNLAAVDVPKRFMMDRTDEARANQTDTYRLHIVDSNPGLTKIWACHACEFILIL